MKLDELLPILRRDPVLVAGPGITSYSDVNLDCLRHLKPAPDAPSSLYDYVENVLNLHPEQESSLRSKIHDFYSSCKTSVSLTHFVPIPWSAVISLTPDDHAFQALIRHYNKSPINWSVANIASGRVDPPANSMPYYSLLGNLQEIQDDSRIPISATELALRKREWRNILATLPDRMQAAPLLMLGMANSTQLVREFLVEFSALRKVAGTWLIARTQEIQDVPSFSKFVERLGLTLSLLDEDIPVIAHRVREHNGPQALLELQYELPGLSFKAAPLQKVADIVTLVPPTKNLSPAVAGHARLLDILFKPNHLNWEPYHARLDLPRDATPVIEGIIEHATKTTSDSVERVLKMVGDSGIGKTVTMRRVAVDLADKKHLVLWVRVSYGESSGGRVDELVKAVRDSLIDKKTPVVIFYDNWISGRISAYEIMAALRKTSINWFMVLCSRRTDVQWSSRFAADAVHDTSSTFQLDSQLSDAEHSRLKEYLVSLGIAKDTIEAAKLIAAIGRQNACDVLCALWYLLPETQQAIEASIIDEYSQLGGTTGAIKRYVDELSLTDHATAAYQRVAAASGLNLTVPVEVLVSSLKTSYGPFLKLLDQKQPLWGLLYDVNYPAAHTHGYTTRNEVVTGVLLDLINGGSLSKRGELECLSELLRACNASTAPYYEFVCDMLIRGKHRLLNKYSYEEGLALYDAAMQSLSAPDRALAHHRGKWIADKGQKFNQAYEALEKAKELRPHPVAQQGEPLESIETSQAAIVVQAVKNGGTLPEEGLELVRKHIALAGSSSFVNLHAQHVYANSLFELARLLQDSNSAKALSSLAEAAAIVDHTLLILGKSAGRSDDQATDVAMLNDLSFKILAVHTSSDDLQGLAERLFADSKNQVGLIYALRHALRDASRKSRGSNFNDVDKLITKYFALVTAAGLEPSELFYQIRVELIVRWKILRKNSGHRNWQQFKSDIGKSINSTDSKTRPLWMFYEAIADYHLGETEAGEAMFYKLRQMHLQYRYANAYRACFCDINGNPHSLRGTLNYGVDHTKFVEGDAPLNRGFKAKANEFRQQSGAPIFFVLAFSFQGPIAIAPDSELINTIYHLDDAPTTPRS
jgi:hypothetical protein